MIRTSARAVIVRDCQLLTIQYRSADRFWYVLPGGGQQRGESLHETVKRECLEEIGAAVEVDRLLYVREFVGKNHSAIDPDLCNHHGIDFMFACHVSDQYTPQSGNYPDPNQTGVIWLSLDRLADFDFYPAALKFELGQQRLDPYLGDVN